MYNHQLDAFICAADEGSFSKAAEKMFITPSALMQQVSLLEKSIGAALFSRNSKGVSLTPIGKKAYDNAKKIVELSDETKEYAKNYLEGPKYKIRVLRTPTAKYRYLSKYIHMMEAQDPNVEFEYVGFGGSGDSNINISDYIDISEGAYFDYSLTRAGFIKLLDSPLCIALPKTHPLYAQRLIEPSELVDTPVFMIAKGFASYLDRVRDILQREGVHIIDVHNLYSEDTFRICRSMNYGLITPAIWQDIHPDLMIHVLTTTVTIPYGIAYYEPLTEPAARFVDLIRKENGL